MNQNLIDKLFHFDIEWEYQDAEITNTYYYPKLKSEVEKIIPISSELEYAAFEYALKLYALQFVLGDNYGGVGKDRLDELFSKRLNRISGAELTELWKHFFPHLELKWMEGDGPFSEKREVHIPDEAVHSVLAKLLAKTLETEIERLRIYFKYSVPKEFWYQLLRLKSNDDDEYHEADSRVQTILG